MSVKKERRKITPQGDIHFAVSERAIVEALRLADDGSAFTEASDLLRGLNKALSDYGGKGFVNIKLHVSGFGPKAKIHVEVTSKKPKSKPEPTTVFLDEHGFCVPHDPNQYQFEFSENEQKELDEHAA
jgi:hypothetical protein